MNILVINGPNLNLLGIRNPEIYGSETLEELMMWLENSTEGKNHHLKFYQSNHEGEIIDIIHDERQWAQGIIINPGALSHYSYAIMDAIKAIRVSAIEVHITDINQRDAFRKTSVVAKSCIKQISGLGKYSYLEGVKILIKK